MLAEPIDRFLAIASDIHFTACLSQHRTRYLLIDEVIFDQKNTSIGEAQTLKHGQAVSSHRWTARVHIFE